MDAKKSDSVQSKLLTNQLLTFFFHLLATISIEDLTDCLDKVFLVKKPSQLLVQALFNRFKPLKVTRDVEGFVRGDDMDIVDFLLGCDLLSRVKQDAKIKRKLLSSLRNN